MITLLYLLIKVNLYENRGILVVSYVIEEATVDITIQMASNHPLGLIRVSSDKSMINMSQWKVWLKQLALFFSHQNGSIIDGISLWQLNITKKFDGVEECYICYSILHNSNYQLPKSACRTCHKKFHSSCLVSIKEFNFPTHNVISKFLFFSINGLSQATNPLVLFAVIFFKFKYEI